MTAPRTRRRYLLPLLGSTLLTAGGGGGWAAYHFGLISGDGITWTKAAADTEVEAGFADAAKQDNDHHDLTSQLATSWSDERTERSLPTLPQSDLPTLPPTDFSSHYATALPALPAPPPSDVATESTTLAALPGADEFRSDALASLPEATELAPTTERIEELAKEMNDEPTVARGQSPEATANSLRPTVASGNSDSARNAFEAQQVAYNAPPQPTANTTVSNPLRQASASQVQTTGGELPSLDSFATDPLAGGLPAIEDEPATIASEPMSAEPIYSAPAKLAPIEAVPLPRAAFAEQELVEIPTGEVPQFDATPSTQPTITTSTRVASREPSPARPTSDFGSTNALRDGPLDAFESTPGATTLASGRPGERALEGPQRPAIMIQKFAPDEIQVGKECKFIIKIRNMGQRPADNVVVNDQVPQGTKLVATAPQADSSAGQISWNLGTLSPGEEREMEMTLLPTEEGEIGSVASVTFAAQASVKANCTRPALALRMTSPNQVMIGRQQRVTIELHNPGTGDATGLMLLENVPENVSHEAGPALEFEVGTLHAGETRRLELVLTAEKAGIVHNVMTARADGNLQVQQHVDFEVIAPGLAIDVEGPARRYLERPATYTVKVDNPGTAPAQDVQLVTQLPRGMKFIKANNLGEYDPATHSIYWSLAELPAGQSGTVELTAMPTEPGEHLIEVRSRAREGLEDQTSRQVSVEGLPAIMFEVADLQDPIEVGGNTAYEVRVVNQGTKAATNVAVRVVTPPGMRVVSATGETRHRIDAQGVVFEPLGRLAPKADTLFRIQLQGVQAGDQRVLVEVDTDDLTQPVRKEESTRVFGDE